MTTYVYNEHDENQVLTMRNKLKKKKRKRRINFVLIVLFLIFLVIFLFLVLYRQTVDRHCICRKIFFEKNPQRRKGFREVVKFISNIFFSVGKIVISGVYLVKAFDIRRQSIGRFDIRPFFFPFTV
mgnify:CR=1 FL=1